VNALVLPLLLPLLTALLSLFLPKSSAGRTALVWVSGLAQIFVSLWLCGQALDQEFLGLTLGGWAAPYGIVFVVDPLTGIMLCLSSITTFAATAFSLAQWVSDEEHPFRLSLLQFITVGINLSFLTSDFFNLFVAFEVMLLSSYALISLEATKKDLPKTLTYVLINVAGSALFLSLAGFAYGYWGTLNFADLSERLAAESDPERVHLFALACTAIFGLKAGVFPLYVWLPQSYPTLPAATAGLFSGMLTKVGVYVLLRVYTTILPHGNSSLYELIGWISVATMLFGVFGAIAQQTIRSVLSWHIISQIGYMVLCLGLFSERAVTACILYITHHIIVKSSLFLVGGTASFLAGTDRLDRMGGLWKVAPLLGILFLVQALSLAGIPPLSGFWGKYLILVEGAEQEKWAFVVGSLLASILTLFSMLKIWLGAFWGPVPQSTAQMPTPDRKRSVSFWGRLSVCAMLATVSLVIGLGMPYFLNVATRAAQVALAQDRFTDFVFSMRGK
jgi:multicomponent Na+:H+ antiporter subunit D